LPPPEEYDADFNENSPLIFVDVSREIGIHIMNPG